MSKKINLATFRPELLEGRYIPNLIAEPYEISKRYAEKIYNQTMSPRLDKVLKAWDREDWGSTANRSKLGYIILVELLAYQFASPVRWIETQDLLFSKFAVERFIEFGPSPTLTGMAQRTLKLKYEQQDGSIGMRRQMLCIAKNQTEIYYHNFAHDGSIAPILGLLQLSQPVWPGMGSEVVFELWSSAGSYYI